MERSLVHLGPRVSTAPRPQQDLAGVELPELGREVERASPEPVRSEGRAPRHEQADALRVPVLGAGQQLLAELHQGAVVDGVRMLTGDGLPTWPWDLDLAWRLFVIQVIKESRDGIKLVYIYQFSYELV